MFFSTYYEDEARRVIDGLRSLSDSVEVKRSRVVKELYYVELRLGSDAGRDEAMRLAEQARSILADAATVYGVKVYVVGFEG